MDARKHRSRILLGASEPVAYRLVSIVPSLIIQVSLIFLSNFGEIISNGHLNVSNYLYIRGMHASTISSSAIFAWYTSVIDN